MLSIDGFPIRRMYRAPDTVIEPGTTESRLLKKRRAMRYMMFIKHTRDYANVQVPPSLYDARGKFIDETTRKGEFAGGAGLLPTAEGSKVKLSGGITVVDGPFTESREIVGGYVLIDAASKNEALELARRFMELHLKHGPTFEGERDVRPLEEQVPPK
jgi:hypothetical protein